MSAHSAYCLDIDQSATFANAGGSIAGLNGNLTLTHSRLVTGCPFSASEGDTFSVEDFFSAQSGSSLGEVDLMGASGWMNGPVLNAIVPSIPADSFFDQVDYIGAVKDSSSDWTAGWTYSD
jgi:hypothetical protein